LEELNSFIGRAKNPTQKELLDNAIEMDKMFGSKFLPKKLKK
jgi:hypothetical protein